MQFTSTHEEQGDCRIQVRSHSNPCFVILVIAFLLIAIFGFGYLFRPARAYASSSGPTMQINAGFGAYFRVGAWVPLYITLSNNGPDFNGTLSTSNPVSLVWQDTYSMVPALDYQQPVVIHHGVQKQITLYLPITAQANTLNIAVQLLDSHGKLIRSQSISLHQVFPGDVLVGLLSDQVENFDALKNVAPLNSIDSMVVEYLNAQNMPSMEAVLANFNIIVLDSFHTSSLTSAQLRALYLWVQQGGSLIEVGGPNWQQTISILPANLQPVSFKGTSILPAGVHLLPVEISASISSDNPISDQLQVPVPISNAAVTGDTKTIVSASGVPLLVQAQSGQGLIFYLAFDPALDPIAHWSQSTLLWRSLVIRSLGAQLLQANTQQNFGGHMPYYLAKLQHLLLVNLLPTPWILLFLFLCYLLILGPVRWLIIRRTKRRQWSWRIILGAIVVFTLLNYAVAFYQGRASIFNNSVSIIQLNNHSSLAHSTTYHGVYVPFASANSTIQVQLPGGSLVQAYVDGSQQSEQADITAIPQATHVQISDTNIKYVDALEAEQDIALQGSIVSHLVLSQGMLSGTVTNTLSTALSDVYVLMPHNIMRVGNIAAGQTTRVTFPLNTTSTNGSQAGCATLVNQVVKGQTGIITQYDHLFTRSVVQSASERQRHLSLLAFMLAGQCTNASFSVPGSPATLIGWADQPLAGENAVTVNTTHAGGLHETAVVAALAIGYAPGPLTIPADVITGQLVDTQALGIHLLTSGAYAFAHGHITFELSLPSLKHFLVQSMTLSQPVDTSILPAEQPAAHSPLHIALYNWHTDSWQIIHLTQSTPFSTQDTRQYFSPDGRMLVQYVNLGNDYSEIAFTMPSLTVTGIQSGA